MSCTSSDIDKITAKFQKGPGKTTGGVRSQDNQCLNNLSPSPNCEKNDENKSEDYSQTPCTSSDLDKNICKVSIRSA